MKKLFIILLFPMLCHGQDTVKHNQGKWVVYALFTTSVVEGALADGLNSRTKYTAGHLLASASILQLIAVPFVIKHPNWKLPATYLLVRFALWDMMYNAGAHRNLNYIGGKNYYDETTGKIPLSVFDASKFAALGLSVVINLK